MAAAAATYGLANKVLEPGPCLPSKFLFDVLTAYFPFGILSSFIARHAEHPGSLISNPASVSIFFTPVTSSCFIT